MALTTQTSRRKSSRDISTMASGIVEPHDHSAELNRLSRIKGQVEGVERMVREKRYCPEIVHQIKAIRSALRNLEANIVEGHMRHCVKEAMKSRDPVIMEERFEEIVDLMKGQG